MVWLLAREANSTEFSVRMLIYEVGPRKTKRFQKIKVRYQNEQMQVRLKTFTGWTAQIIQHEMDHCKGILI